MTSKLRLHFKCQKKTGVDTVVANVTIFFNKKCSRKKAMDMLNFNTPDYEFFIKVLEAQTGTKLEITQSHAILTATKNGRQVDLTPRKKKAVFK